MKTRLSTLIACGLAVAALIVAGCGNGYSSPSMPTPNTPGSSNVTITIVGANGSQSFSPNPAMVKVGQTVTWYDADLAAHDVVADAGQFNVGNIAYLGTSVPVAMSAEGTITYHSQGNPTMIGTLIVTQ